MSLLGNRILGEQAATESNAENAKVLEDLEISINEARRVLTANGYGDLQSIALRVAALENQLTAAISMRDGKEISRLGAALDRAKKGLPPLTVVEKKAKTIGTERRPRITKAVKDILEAFDSEILADAEGHVVTSIKADDTGKGCLVQWTNSNEWVGVDPAALKPFKDVAAKGSGTPSTQGELSDAAV